MDKAIVITKEGKITVVDCPEDVSLKWMYSQINCEWIEIVRPRRLKRGFVMIVDEEGLLKPNRLNCHGSYLYETDKHGQPIVGDVLILKECDGGVMVVESGVTDSEQARKEKQQLDYAGIRMLGVVLNKLGTRKSGYGYGKYGYGKYGYGYGYGYGQKKK